MSMQNLFRDTDFAAALEAHPVAFHDIGARGGFDSNLWPIAFGVDAVGFEPNPQEYKRLNAAAPKPWRSSRFLPVAIGDRDGKHTLHIPSDPQAASLLPPLTGLPDHLYKKQFFKIEETLEVDTLTFDHALDKFDAPPPDFLKIDIEGLELGVFQSSPRMMDHVLAVKVEVAFVHLRELQPAASEIESFMRNAGFSLMDFVGGSRWRRDGDVIHPHMSKGAIPYSRGQLIHGDYLFFRNPAPQNNVPSMDTARRLKLAFIAMSFGYFDFASDIFAQDQVMSVLEGAGCPRPQETLSACSRRYGRIIARREFFRHVRLLGPYLRRASDLILR